MKKKILVWAMIFVCATAFSQTLDTGKLFIGAGVLYNNHSSETFDGLSYYSGDTESFIAPLWANALGFYASAGMAYGDSVSGFELRNSLEYSLAFHEGSHSEGSFTGYFNEVAVSAAFSFFKIAKLLQPYISGALTWSWMQVDNGVILADNSTVDASFPGMAFLLGAGVIIDLHVIEIDARAGYRIMDYLSGTYEGFSAHFGGIANGWYAKAGINLVFYE